MADDDPSEIHLHWEPPSENLIHRGGVDIKWNGPWRGKCGLTVLSFFSCGISVIWILKWGVAVISFSPAVCGISSFWLTVFGKRRSRYCGTVHCPLLFHASLRSRRLDDPSRVSLTRARSLSRPLLPSACYAG